MHTLLQSDPAVNSTNGRRRIPKYVLIDRINRAPRRHDTDRLVLIEFVNGASDTGSVFVCPIRAPRLSLERLAYTTGRSGYSVNNALRALETDGILIPAGRDYILRLDRLVVAR